MKLAIVSDLHCKYSENDKDARTTFLYSDDLGKVESRHPVKALNKLINDHNLSADYLLCPGDITDGADPQGLITGWNSLEKIRDRLKANFLISTVGNHDASSRDSEADNPFESLKVLDAKYPLPTKEANDEYWLEGFSIFAHEQTLFLIFNSCYSHANTVKAQTSKISQSQIESISKKLHEINLTNFKYRIFLCHHHPINHGNIDHSDHDIISNGDKLLKILTDYKFQVCIHGHKHDPKIRELDNLSIFCSGSFSSLMNVNDIKADNTFHLLHLEENNSKGYISTWVYMPLKGWIQRDDSPFPCNVGFGFDGQISNIATELNDIVDDEKVSYIEFEKLILKVKDLRFLNLYHQIELTDILKDKYNLVFIPAYPNKPQVLIKQVI